MTLICFGISHHTAPVELRERAAYSPSALRSALATVKAAPGQYGVSELVLLSTCNRLEVYGLTTNGGPPPWNSLLELLAKTLPALPSGFESYFFRYIGSDAAAHLCRVAAGLDSMVLGESEILGQVGAAHKEALALGACGPGLTSFFRIAVRAGRRARSETAIGRNPASVSSVAVEQAVQIWGQLQERQVTIVGAGRMARKTAAALRARGVANFTIVNRTRERAIDLAEEWAATQLDFDRLQEAIAAADIVITSTGSTEVIVTHSMASAAMAPRNGRPLLFIDIAMPRDVDPAVRQIPGVLLLDLDDLQTRLGKSISERRKEIPSVEAIVAEELARLAELESGVAP
jgi:glutamyl-tRNA reductase